MTESITPPIYLTLDRPRILRLDIYAILAAERALARLWGTRVSLFTVLSDLTTLGLNDLSVLLWQALRDDDPTLTLEQTQGLMDFAKMPQIIDAVLQAWNAATAPAVERSSEEIPRDPLAPIFPGSVSGALPVSNLA